MAIAQAPRAAMSADGPSIDDLWWSHRIGVLDRRRGEGVPRAHLGEQLGAGVGLRGSVHQVNGDEGRQVAHGGRLDDGLGGIDKSVVARRSPRPLNRSVAMIDGLLGGMRRRMEAMSRACSSSWPATSRWPRPTSSIGTRGRRARSRDRSAHGADAGEIEDVLHRHLVRLAGRDEWPPVVLVQHRGGIGLDQTD
jgi:hypothetical protein